MERHESQNKSIALLLSNATLSGLFVKYNTAIPSSATVEHLFSLRKDVLKQKESELSNQWWIHRMRQEKHLTQLSPFGEARFMVFQIVIKLYEFLEKNISQRSNYFLFHSETSRFEIKGIKHKT